MTDVTLSLVSHTNVGKTTLARTLLRRDVGTVFDQAHVTETPESWTLLEAGGHRLVLVDTPGFGDTARLMLRLRREGDPVGWFLHAVWDRMRDRALYCSQEAMRSIRDQSDVVLYLVNAAEHPDEAGYVDPELELLGWLDRPVLLLLNQVGDDGAAAGGGATGPGAGGPRGAGGVAPAGGAQPAPGDDGLLAAWRGCAERHVHVRGVLALDAFTRSWVQEGVLFDRVAALLPDDRRRAMERLANAWRRRQLEVLERSVAAMAEVLVETAADGVTLPGLGSSRGEKRRAMRALAERLEQREQRLLDELVAAHGLDGTVRARLAEAVDDFLVAGEPLLDVRRSALWGGLAAGAAAGVTAEMVSGGLSLGGGFLAGATAGALGGAGLARGYQLVFCRGRPTVSWGAEFLAQLVVRVVGSYLVVASFGRGQGAFGSHALEGRVGWRQLAADVVQRHHRELAAAWRLARREDGAGRARTDVASLLDTVVRTVLVRMVPEGGAWLEAEGARATS